MNNPNLASTQDQGKSPNHVTKTIKAPPFDPTNEEFSPVQLAVSGHMVDETARADAMFPDAHEKAVVEMAQRSEADPLLQMSLVSIGANYCINAVRIRRGCAGFGDRAFGGVVDERSPEDRKAAALRVSEKIGFDQPKREIVAILTDAMRPRPVFDDTRHIWQPYDNVGPWGGITIAEEDACCGDSPEQQELVRLRIAAEKASDDYEVVLRRMSGLPAMPKPPF